MTMGNPDYAVLVERQGEYFLSGSTRPAAWRKARLKALFIESHDELCEALWKDLRRNVTDADLMDVAYNVKEADYALAHLDAWMEPQRVHTPLVFEPGHVRVRRDPPGSGADHRCVERARRAAAAEHAAASSDGSFYLTGLSMAGPRAGRGLPARGVCAG
jgi:hypothetical protein